MRNLPEERLKRRQSDSRKETMQRIALWSIVVISVCFAGVELITSIA